MRITQLHLDNFQQFNQLSLNFTYPEGHEKAGQPLDKICFIGQSGTGKTTLLNLIQNHIHQLDFLYRKQTNLGISRSELFSDGWKYHQKGVHFSSVFKDISLAENDVEGIVIKTKDEQQNSLDKLLQLINSQKRLSIYLPAELIENTAIYVLPEEQSVQIKESLKSILNTSDEVSESKVDYQTPFKDKIVILNKKQSKIVWQFLLEDIKAVSYTHLTLPTKA